MGGGSDKQTVNNTPWSGAIPYLTGNANKNIPGILPEAAAQYQSTNPQYFPGSTVAPFAPESEIAFNMGANRAMEGSPLNTAAGAETLKTLSGDYLGAGNPYLDAIKQQGLRDASAAAGRFSSHGRVGSGAMNDAIASAYTAATAPYFFNAYEGERGRMGQAAQFAPTLANQDYVDLNNLNAIGQQRQQQGQQELTDEVNRWNFNQNRDAQKLQQYADLIRGTTSGFGTQTSTTPTQSPFQSILGGVASIAPLFFL